MCVRTCVQIRYSVREYACKVVDVLARRTRLAFLNVQAAEEAMPRIIEIMAEELNWTSDRMKVRDLLLSRVVRFDLNVFINDIFIIYFFILCRYIFKKLCKCF